MTLLRRVSFFNLATLKPFRRHMLPNGAVRLFGERMRRTEEAAEEMNWKCLAKNTLITSLCRDDKVEEALVILRDMDKWGLEPNLDSFNAVIKGLCREWMTQEAEEMIDNGIAPDAVTYSDLIQDMCLQQRLPEAFDLFQDMLRRDVSPDKPTYTRLMAAYCLEGEISKAFHLHHEMIHKVFLPDLVTGFTPSLVTYNALIHGYCILGRVEEALEILRGMTEMGLSPDGVSYSTVISGFCRIRELGKAYELNFEMTEKEIRGMNEVVYGSLIQGLSNEVTYTSLINSYCAKGDVYKAITLYDEMSHNGYEVLLPLVCL